MFVQTAVLLSTTDRLTVIVMDQSFGAIAVHAILMRLENSQDHAIMFKSLRVLNLAVAMALFAVNLRSLNMETTFGEIAIADSLIYLNNHLEN